MANQKLTDLSVTSSAAQDDLAYLVKNPSTSPVAAAIQIDGLFFSRSKTDTVLSHASLAAAVSAAGSTQTTIEIPSSTAVTADLTVPVNITLLFIGSGVVSVSSGKTLTINGPLIAPLRQIFSGSGSVRLGLRCAVAFPEWFGAVMDGTTDDQAAAQKAIDAFAPVGNSPLGGEVLITGYMAIGSTLTISSTNVALRGFGWAGSQSAETRSGRSVIRWIGSAGSPMILIHALGCKIASLRLKGKSTAKPSAAIEISESGGVFCDNTSIRDVWIGSLYGFDDDNTVQFTKGIYFSGSVDSDTNSLFRVFINACTTGIDIANANASVNHFDTIQTTGCTTGIKTVAPQVIITNWICALNDVDLEMAAQGNYVELYNYVSEGSGRMAVGSSLGPYKLIVRGGGFQADPAGKFTPADFSGKRAFIKFIGLAGAATYIDLHDFNLTSNGTPATPIIQAWNTSDNTTGAGSTAVHVKVDACPGILTSTIDVGNDGFTNSSRIVEYTPVPAGQVQAQMIRFVQNSGYGSEDSAFQDGRFDLLGKVNVYGGPLKVKKLADLAAFQTSVTPTGSGATNYSYKVVPLTYDGHGAPSVAATCTNGTLGSGGRVNTLTWHPVPGAYAYRIYGRTAGSEALMATVTLSTINQQGGNQWIDNGSVTPSGALPSGNTTGNLSVDGFINSGKGTDVASAATITPTGNIFHVTGTTTITSVSGTGILAGTEITIIFDSTAQISDGSNLKLAGNFTGGADRTITLIYDGTNYYEKCRSTN